MYKFLITLFACWVVSTAAALDIDGVMAKLGSADYSERQDARNDLMQTLAEATAPGVDSEELRMLEDGLGPYLDGELPLASRLYLIGMFELFGSARSVDVLYPLLENSDEKVRDSVRRALSTIPGDRAGTYLISGLEKSAPAEKVHYIAALAYRGDPATAPVIANELKSDVAEVVVAVAQALGVLGNKDVVSDLLAAHKAAKADTLLAIEASLLNIGVDVDVAVKLVKKGRFAATRLVAYQQLKELDAKRADRVLRGVLSNPAYSGRALFLREVMVNGSEADRLSLVEGLEDASDVDRLVIVTAIGDLGLSEFEPQTLALLADTEGVVQARVIETLGVVGGEASFGPLNRIYRLNPKTDGIVSAMARLRTESADKRFLDVAQSGPDTATQVEAIRILALRNSDGGTALLNAIARDSVDGTLRKAAFTALETIGDVESLKVLSSVVLSKGELTRPAQRSLKRLSTNFGAADYLWTEVYKPALDGAVDSDARAGLVLILDGIAGEESLAYLKEVVMDPSSGLESSAQSTLMRWPYIESADVWVEIVSAEGASAKEISMGERAIKRALTNKDIDGKAVVKLNLALRAVQNAPSVDFKLAILSCYEGTLLRWEKESIKSVFKPLLDDPDVSEVVKAILDFS